MRKNKNVKAEERVRVARARASFLRGYFASALYALIPIESEMVPTMAVDVYGRLYYSPTFVLSVTIDELTSVCLHEVGHKLRRHHERADAIGVTEATHKIANWCQDAELNDDHAEEVKKFKDVVDLPGSPFYPSTFGFEDGKMWETYYFELLKQALPFNPSPSTDPSAEGSGEGDGDGDGDGDSDSEKGSGSSKSKGEGKDGKGSSPAKSAKGGFDASGKHNCGSAAHGVRQPWELGAPNADGSNEGLEDGDWRNIERIVASEIKAEAAKGRGTVPGSWVDWANELLKPVHIPWDQELSVLLKHSVNTVSGRVFHSYARPSRRQNPEIVFPSMRSPIPCIAFIGDTSGSMSGRALGLVRGVVQDICSDVQADLRFIATDMVAHDAQKVTDGHSLEMKGRGGTDMRAGFAAAEEIQPPVDIIVIATDCDTPWPEVEPLVPVIVCAIDASESAIAAIPRWATVIIVEEDACQS